jgi:hypothetical protein
MAGAFYDTANRPRDIQDICLLRSGDREPRSPAAALKPTQGIWAPEDDTHAPGDAYHRVPHDDIRHPGK